MKQICNTTVNTHQRILLSNNFQFSLKILEMDNVQLYEYLGDVSEKNPFLILENSIYETTNIDDHSYDKLTAKEDVISTILQDNGCLTLSKKNKLIVIELIDYMLEKKYLSFDFIDKIEQKYVLSHNEMMNFLQNINHVNENFPFCFNFTDKLRILLNKKCALDTKTQNLLSNINLLFLNQFDKLQKVCNCSRDELFGLLRKIKQSINISFDKIDDIAQYIYPDITINEITKGDFLYEINKDFLSNIKIDKALYGECSNILEKKDKKFIEDNYKQACLVIKSIYSRNKTLINIAKEIIHRNYEFFIGEKSNINALKMSTIANSMFLNVSTISRAISNKHMLTPNGIFPFKYFFSNASNKNCKNHIDNNVFFIKSKIQEIINKEPQNNPYSDELIEKNFFDNDIRISRRTIAKYRLQLNIPNSLQRSIKYSLLYC